MSPNSIVSRSSDWMAGHMFGLDATACFEAKCAEVLRDRVDGGHLEALRVMLLLGEARLVGISDAEVDPFSHASKAQEELVRLVTATDVAQAASPAVWRAHYDAGMEVVQNGLDRDPRRIAASLLQLAAQVTREAQAVGREMVGQGLAPPAAQLSASLTVTAGLASCITGDLQVWIERLSRASRAGLPDLDGDEVKAHRRSQANCIRRFANFRAALRSKAPNCENYGENATFACSSAVNVDHMLDFFA